MCPKYLNISFVSSFIITFRYIDKMTETSENFYKLCGRQKQTAQVVTMKAEERSINDGSYISPPGHLSTVKNLIKNETELSFNLVTMSGVRMEDGRTWPNAGKMFSRKVILKEDNFDTKTLKVLSSFQVTSSSDRTTKGSVIPELINSAYIDLEPPKSENMHLVIFGGQYVDKYTTSDDLVIIKGPADFSSAVDVTLWKSHPVTYSEFIVPDGWSDGSNIVQKGDVPISRSGAKMGVLGDHGEIKFMVMTGGFHLPTPGPVKMQAEDSSFFILKYPEMTWKKLPNLEVLKRNFHGMKVVGNIVYVLGGWKFENGVATKLFPLTEVTRVILSDDHKIVNVDTISLLPSNPETKIPWISGFSVCGDHDEEEKIYVFSGNLFKDYKADKENLFEFLPPKTNRNILAPKSNQLLTINLSGKTISSESAPQEAGGNCTTMQMIDEGPALVIVSDPGIWLFSPTSKSTPLKCDPAEEYGFCK